MWAETERCYRPLSLLPSLFLPPSSLSLSLFVPSAPRGAWHQTICERQAGFMLTLSYVCVHACEWCRVGVYMYVRYLYNDSKSFTVFATVLFKCQACYHTSRNRWCISQVIYFSEHSMGNQWQHLRWYWHTVDAQSASSVLFNNVTHCKQTKCRGTIVRASAAI